MKTLKRLIYVLRAFFIYIGIVIGPGMLVLPVIAANPAKPHSILSWWIVIIISFPIAYTFACLSRDNPSAKGSFSIVHEAFGLYSCALTGWYHSLATSVSTLIISLTGGFYLAYAFGLAGRTAFIAAGFILTLSVFLNYVVTETAGRVQAAVGIVTITGLILIIFSMRHHIFTLEVFPDLSSLLISRVPRTTILAFWFLLSWDAILRLQPIFYHPKADIFMAVLGAALFSSLLYLGINLAFAGTFYSYLTANEPGSIITFINQEFVPAAPWIAPISLLALLISLNTSHSLSNSFGRMAFWLSHDKLAPQWLEHIHERFSVPDRANLAFWAFGLMGLAITYAFNIQIIQLLYAANSLGIATFILISAAATKQSKSKTGRVLASTCLLFCLSILPFLGIWILIPLMIALSCPLYVYWRERRESLYY